MTDLLDGSESMSMGAGFRQSLLKVAMLAFGKEAASPLLHKLRSAAKRPAELISGSRADKLEAAAIRIGDKLRATATKPGIAGKLQKLREAVTGTGTKRRASRLRQAKAYNNLANLAAAENAKVHDSRRALVGTTLVAGTAIGAKKLTDMHRKQKESAMEKDAGMVDAAKTIAKRTGIKATRALQRPAELITGERAHRMAAAGTAHRREHLRHMAQAARATDAAAKIHKATDRSQWPQAAALEAHALTKAVKSLRSSARESKASRKIVGLRATEQHKSDMVRDMAAAGLAATPMVAASIVATRAKKRKKAEQLETKHASFHDDAVATKIACARELLLLNAISPEMAKAATVSPETARRAMDRLSGMEETKPGVGQVARYAGIGGGGGAAIAALGNVIEGYKRPTTPGIKGHLAALGRAAVRADKNPRVGDKVRSIASTGVKGALGAGVIPLARSGTDRAAERKTLKKYIAQHASEHVNA